MDGGKPEGDPGVVDGKDGDPSRTATFRPPGPARVVGLLARLALRRWLNRMGSGFRRGPRTGRSGTPRKNRGGSVWMALLGIFFFINSFNLTTGFLHRLGQAPTRDAASRIAVSLETYQEIVRAHSQWDQSRDSEEKRADIVARLESCFSADLPQLSERERAARSREMAQAFLSRGIRGFQIDSVLRAVGTFLFFLSLGQIWLSLGTGNQDLGRVEWSLEWLFTFPASGGRLFLAKVFEYAIVNPFGWFVTLPFLVAVLWGAGYETRALPLAAAATLALGLLQASIRLVLETWLRMRLSLDRLKNVQAGCFLVGTVLWLGLLLVALAQPTPSFFLKLVPHAPLAALWNPFSLPVLFCDRAIPIWSPAAAIAAAALTVPLLAVAACRRFVRDGLLMSSGTLGGSRLPLGTAPSLERPAIFRGILAKDLRLLFRDRNFLVGTVVVPVLVFAFQIVLYPNLLKSVTGDYRHAATLAFGLGAYVLMSSAFHVLTVEGNSLWLLYTFPRELHAILLQKTCVWAGVALVYAGIVLGVTAAFGRSLDETAFSLGVTAVVGVAISAFIAAALGTLATDPLQREQQRKIRPEIVYLYMLLSGLYGFAIYGPSTRPRVVLVILFALLVLALWQKVRDRLPFLLDPTETPPPRIALSDGLIALLFFFVFQGMVAEAAARAGVPLGPPLVLAAYAGAGGFVMVFTLYLFWRLRVPRLLEAVGFRSREGSVLGACSLGPLAGLAAAALAMGWLWVVDHVERLRLLKEESRGLEGGLLGSPWFSLLAIGAAPLVEEYLFRGLIYRGLRRTMKPAFAVLASAGLFAIVHSPLAFVPVLGVGVATALVFERTKLLLSPILAHAVYNLAMLEITRRSVV